MSNTHHISLAVAALAVTFNFTAAAQTIAVAESSSAQVESPAAVAQPLSITQRYVPAASPMPKAGTPLQLLVDDSQAETLQPAPLAQSDEIGTQPAINTLRPGRFALTVSQVSRTER
ncbi:MAG: hypothetical protein ACYCZX_20080 [Rhodospirillaceae bacterium]